MLELAQSFREGALLVARTDLATLEVTGPDRSSWLQGVVTNDLAPLARGAAVYSLALNKKGKIVADLIVASAADRLLLAVHQSVLQETHAHLDHLLVMEDAEIGVSEQALCQVHAIGPLAGSVLESSRAADGLVAAAPCSFAGFEGAALWFRQGAEQPIVDSLCASTQSIRSADVPGLDRLRPIVGWPRFPADFDNDSYPQEIGLDERAVSFQKGCYLGQEIVLKMRSRGHPSRSLVRVVASCDDGAVPWQAREPVLNAAGVDVGAVTSAARSLEGDRIAGFALLKWSESTVGAAVTVGGRQGTLLPAWGLLEPRSA